ncbi:MAG: pitrilysin family protein [Gemmatimonadota bacterium]
MSNRIRPLLLLAFLAVPLTAQRAPTRAAGAPAAPVKGATVEGITEYRLANGLKVLLFPDQSKPTVTVNITYLVGSRHEAYGETGMAHLLEHLVFKGTPTHRDIPKELSERGARPNGTTWFDRTNYFETIPASDANLTWAIDLEADRMVNSFISAKDLESEMTVVRNEFESGENSPERTVWQTLLATGFQWHNYGKSTIGARSDIENVPITRLQAFYRKYYQPDNAVLVVAGKFDEAKTLDLVNRRFGRIPKPVRSIERGNILYDTYTRDPAQDGERTATVRRVGDKQIFGVMYKVPALAHPDNAAVQVLSALLSQAPGGRLYAGLVDTKLAASVTGLTFDLREPGVLIAWADIRKEQSLDSARIAMLKVLDETRTATFTAAEVERARNEVVSSIEQVLDNSENVGFALTEFEASGDWRLLHISRDRLKAVTPADLQRVAAAYLKPDNRATVAFVPTEKPDRAELPATPDIQTLVRGYVGTQKVAEGEVFDATPANIDSRIRRQDIPGSLRVTMLPKRTRGEVVQGTVVLRFGTLSTLMNRRVPATLAGAMLMRGTTARTRQQMKDTLDKLKASVSVSGTVRSATASFQVRREHLAPTLRLVAEMLRSPSFDAAEFEKLRTERLAQLEAGLGDPQQLAVRELSRVGAPKDKAHPLYAPTLPEDIADWKAVTLDAARTFHREFYGANNGDLGLVGDFDADSARALAGSAFSNWSTPQAWALIPEPFERTDSTLVSIETPDKPNAMFLGVQAVRLADGDPDFAAMSLATEILGGGFLKSRMADRLRQKDGLSYGVGSQISVTPGDSAGSLLTYAIYAPQNLDRLQLGFREELDRFVRDGVTAEELEAARAGWLQARQQVYANDNELVGQMINRRRWNRTFTSYDLALESQVKKLTLAEVNAVIRRHVDPKQTVIIRAGDFEGAKKKAATPTP